MRKAIDKNIAQAASVQALKKDIVPLFGEARARAIAVTETTRLYAKGANASYRALGVNAVVWETAMDRAVDAECADLEGQVWPIDEAPQPPLHINCRCGLGAAEVAEGGGPGDVYNQMPAEEVVLTDYWETASERWAYESVHFNATLRGESIVGKTTGSAGRKITQQMASETAQEARTIQVAAEKFVTEHKTLYRGESFASWDDLAAKYSKGGKVKLDGLTSTAVQDFDAANYMMAAGDEVISEMFPFKAMIHFTDKSGVVGAPVYPLGVDFGAGEIVLARGKSYVVKSIQRFQGLGRGNIPKGQDYYKIILEAA